MRKDTDMDTKVFNEIRDNASSEELEKLIKIATAKKKILDLYEKDNIEDSAPIVETLWGTLKV